MFLFCVDTGVLRKARVVTGPYAAFNSTAMFMVDVLIFNSCYLHVNYYDSVNWMHLAQAVVKTVMNFLFHKRHEIS
jgi:hypothetical protein